MADTEDRDKLDDLGNADTVPMHFTFFDVNDFQSENLDEIIFGKILQQAIELNLGNKDTIVISTDKAGTAFPFHQESKVVSPGRDIQSVGKIIIESKYPIHSYVQRSISLWLSTHKITKGSKVEFRINDEA